MNTKAKGAKFELAVKHALTDAGWLVVKSSDSKGPADLIAARTEAGCTRLLLIEAKGGGKSCPPAQWNRLWETTLRYGGEPVLADKVPGIAAPRFWTITGPKSGRGEAQPRVPLNIEEWQADAA